MNNEAKYSIVIATGIYPPHTGGPALYASEIEKIYRAQGHRVTIATYTFERSLPTGIRHIVYFFRTLMLLRGADMVIVVDTFSAAVPALLGAKILGTPSILRTGGDFLWEAYVERTRKKILLRNFYSTELPFLTFKEKVIFELIKFSYRCAHVVAFSTEWQKNIFLGPYNLAALKRVTVIENALIQPATLVQKSTTTHSTSKVVYAATRPLVWKNNDILQKAVNAVRQQHPEIDVVFGPFSQEDASARMQVSYIVAQVSLGDISPNMILEALSYGKPCIVTEECGIIDTIRPYVTVVNPLDVQSIIDALTYMATPEGYSKACQKAAQYVVQEKRSWSNVAHDIIQTALMHTSFRGHNEHTERCLMISTDRGLLDPDSRVSKRHSQYASDMASLDIIVFAQGKQRAPVKIGPNCTVYSTQSALKYMYIIDALMIALVRPIPTKITCQDPFETGVVGLITYAVMSMRKLLYGGDERLSFEVQIHTDISTEHYRKHSALNVLRYYCSQLIIRTATYIRVVSHTLKKFLIQKFNIPADRILVRPIDIDKIALDAVRINREEWLRSHPIGKSDVVLQLLVIARLESEKRVHIALLVCQELRKHKIMCKLTIVGSGTLKTALQMQVNSLSLNDSVEFIDWTQNVYSYYAQAHCILSTSLYEGYGLVLAESAYIGVPLVTTRVGIADELALEYPNRVVVIENSYTTTEAEIVQKMTEGILSMKSKESTESK